MITTVDNEFILIRWRFWQFDIIIIIDFELRTIILFWEIHWEIVQSGGSFRMWITFSVVLDELELGSSTVLDSSSFNFISFLNRSNDENHAIFSYFSLLILIFSKNECDKWHVPERLFTFGIQTNDVKSFIIIKCIITKRSDIKISSFYLFTSFVMIN